MNIEETMLFVQVSTKNGNSRLCTKSRHEAQHLEFTFEVHPQLIDFLCKAAIRQSVRGKK